MSTTTLYPPSPALSDTSFLEPSREFKNRTYRMIFGIVLFILLYLVLIAFGLALLTACAWLAFKIITMRVMWVTIVISAGLVALGVMFFFFTIKFIFATTKVPEALEIQVTEEDHPVLFDFIRKLSNEVGTSFPRKIFLVPEVNAFVSYNSSFWSMFLPIRKNLRIGLGLVNTLNVSEFKATIAHEFGHFSQKSMKAGSYVYTMNKVIYNLTYQRDKFDELLAGWASAGNTFSFFAALTSFFVEGVRAVLRLSYAKLNVTYMALSREMEYHADLVACSVAGNEAMVNTLRKIEFGDVTYQQTINSLNDIASKSKHKVADIYALHSKLIKQMAIARKLELKNGLPIITSEDLYKGVMQSRLLMKDQWASHPSREEREASIGRFPIQSSIMNESAWVLFNNSNSTREEMTKLMYGENAKGLSAIDDDAVNAYLKTTNEEMTLSPTFEGIYEGRMISKFDPDKSTRTVSKRFDQIINPAFRDTIKKNDRDEIDLLNLKSIAQKRVQVEFFEFDGQKYKSSEASKIIEQLEKDVESVKKEIQSTDEEIFNYYRQRAIEAQQENELIELYRKLFLRNNDSEVVFDLVMRLQNVSLGLDEHPSVRIHDIERNVKKFMRELPSESITEHFAGPEEVFKYLNTERLWNESPAVFNEQGFSMLHNYLIWSMNAANTNRKNILKEIHQKQLALTPLEFVKSE